MLYRDQRRQPDQAAEREMPRPEEENLSAEAAERTEGISEGRCRGESTTCLTHRLQKLVGTASTLLSKNGESLLSTTYTIGNA